MPLSLSLPIAAEALIPHRRPMRLVERLVFFAAGQGEVEAFVDDDCVLLDTDGTLGEIGLVEMLAQAFAAVQGYADLLAGGEVRQGFLVGIRKITLIGPARRGDNLRIRIRTLACMDGFAVVEGEVLRQGQLLAQGNLKLWIPQEGAVS